MKKAIEIEEMRISSNGEHLEFIINCPEDYHFTEFMVLIGDEDDYYSIGESLFFDENNEPVRHDDNRFIGQVPVKVFGVSKPEVYKIHLEAKHDVECHPPDEYIEEIDEDQVDTIIPKYEVKDGFVYNTKYGFVEVNRNNLKETPYTYNPELKKFFYKESSLSDIFAQRFTVIDVDDSPFVVDLEDAEQVKAICEEHIAECECEKANDLIFADCVISDVSGAYNCLIDDILSLQAKCTDKATQDRVIRNYLTLYAHQEAMRLGYIDEAIKWFGLIDNCFTGKCGNYGGRKIKSGCNCGNQRKHHEHHHNDYYTNFECNK